MIPAMHRLWEGFRVGMPINGIPLRWYATVTRWLNGIKIAGGTVRHTPDGIILYPNTFAGQKPWQGEKIADGSGSITVRVNKGRWLRNIDNGNSMLTLDCGADEYKDVTVGDDQYLCAVVGRDVNDDYDPRLVPTWVKLFAADDYNVLLVSDSTYGGLVVLGKATGGAWAQWWHGGDITDDEQVGDEDSRRTAYPDAHSIEKNAAKEFQLSDFAAGTAADALTSYDRIVVRISTSGGTVLRVKYATPQQIADAAAGTPGTTVPDHDHTGDTGDGGTIDHGALGDVVSQAVSDDHRGGRTAAAGINFGDPAVAGHPYIHANGDATRNAMTGVLGSGNAKQSIDPSNRSLFDGDEQASLNWQVRELRKGNSDDTWEAYDCHFLVRDATKSFKHGSDTGFTDSRTFTQVFDDGTSVKLRYAGGIVVPA